MLIRTGPRRSGAFLFAEKPLISLRGNRSIILFQQVLNQEPPPRGGGPQKPVVLLAYCLAIISFSEGVSNPHLEGPTKDP